MFAVFCNDGTFCAKDQKDVNEAMQELRTPIVNTEGNELPHRCLFDINKDGNLAADLGIEIERVDDATLNLSQMTLDQARC